MPILIKKEKIHDWLSNKSIAYVNGWTSFEKGELHIGLDDSNYSETEYAKYTEGYSQCFNNQACIDNINQ